MSPRRTGSSGRSARVPGSLAAVLLALAAVVLAAALFARSSFDGFHYYEPAGYVGRVQALIDDGVLSFDPDDPGTLVFDPGGSSELAAFYEESYLAEDVERFNRRLPGSSLFLEDGRLRVAPEARRIELPFAPARRWDGRLLWSGGEGGAVLEGPGTTLTFEPPAPDELPLSPGDYVQVPLASMPRAAAGAAFELTSVAGASARRFARLEPVGDDVVLTVVYGEPQVSAEVAVDGVTIPVDHRVRLEDGDTILLRRPGLERVLVFRGGEGGAVLRRSREVNGARTSVTDSASLPLAADLVAGIEAIVRRQETRDPVREFEVTLTLDRTLHERIQERLERFVARRGRTAAPAAVTLMDATDGDLLALASWPPPPVLADLSLPDRRRRRLAQNQNLVLHSVGSAIKPFLAAGFWEPFARLGDLEVESHAAGGTSRLLGIELTRPLPLFDHPRVDRRSFLPLSCNAYMTELALLALSEGGRQPGSPGAGGGAAGGEPGAFLAGSPVTRRPAVGRYIEGNRVRHLERHRMAAVLADAFGIETVARGALDPGANTAARYDLDPLDPLLDWLALDPAEARPLFAVAPERVNLRLNQVQLLREELVTLLLGGASGEWNNVQLAEAMARIGSGRAVAARLVASVRGEGREPLGAGPEADEADEAGGGPGAVALSARTLAWLRDGLARVTGAGATAGALGGDVETLRTRLASGGRRVVFYSKTGTAQAHETAPPWSAVYIFYVGVESPAGAVERAVSGAVWIEDRGGASVAVELARGVLEEIGGHLAR